MIKHAAVERLRGSGQPARAAAIRRTGPRVSARMIVRKHDARAVMNRRVRDDLPDRESSTALVTVVAADVEAPRFVVDMSDPKLFARRIPFHKTSGEESAGSR